MIAAYLDHWCVGMQSVRASGKDYILIVRHYTAIANREQGEGAATVPCNNPLWC